ATRTVRREEGQKAASAYATPHAMTLIQTHRKKNSARGAERSREPLYIWAKCFPGSRRARTPPRTFQAAARERTQRETFPTPGGSHRARHPSLDAGRRLFRGPRNRGHENPHVVLSSRRP